MISDLEASITDALRDIRYHPEFVGEAEARLQAAVERTKGVSDPSQHMPEIRARAIDHVLMQQKYFTGRLQFLLRLIPYLENRPEPRLDVAEDGCGTGIDLHVVQTLLPNKVTLTGIDNSAAALAQAKERVPNVTYQTDFDGGTYDVIYGDFVSIDNNHLWDIAIRGDKTYEALRSPGLVLQNIDMRQLDLYRRAFGQRFQGIFPPELLAEIPDGPNCYFCKFEKTKGRDVA